MLKTLQFLIFSLFIFDNLYSSYEDVKARSQSAAVVGSGASGLTAADELAKKGYTVTIISPDEHFGGKCYSFKENSKCYDMGAIEVANYYDEVYKLCAKYGVTLTEMPPHVSLHAPTQTWISQWRQDYSYARIVQDLVKYMYYAYQYRNLEPGFVDIHEDPVLVQTLDKFIEQHNLQSLTQLFTGILGPYGYEHLDQTPMAHAFTYISYRIILGMFGHSLPIVKNFTRPTLAFIEEGYEELFKRMGVDLQNRGVTLQMGQRVERIEHFDNYCILYTTAGEQQFDKVVISCLPQFIDMPFLTDDQQKTISKIFTSNYGTVVFNGEFLDSHKVYIDPFEDNWQITQPMGFVQKFPNSDIQISYHQKTGRSDDIPVIEEVSKDLEREISTYVMDTFYTQPSKFHVQRFVPYYPRASIEDIRKGFYNDLATLQQYKNLKFTGGLWSFELVEVAIRHAKYIVLRHF